MHYKYTIHQSHQDKKKYLIHIKDYFNKANTTIHKARNELKVIPYNDIEVVVKSFQVPNLINQIAYSLLRDSKAKKAYDNALKIGNFTPKPIGYIEFYNGFLLKESYFLAENFQYDFTIREPLLDANFNDAQEIFRAFARFTLKLHNNGIFHNDYSPGNILIKKENGNYIFKIVDINRMKFINLTLNDRARNFSKLWAHDYILEIIADEYQKHYTCSDDFKNKVLYYSNKNKKVKNFKKRLKGKPVND